MAFTKVAPAGIGSTPGDGYRIGDSFLHSTGVEITNINATGILTAASLDISGSIDFDGHTELDNVNISGVSTFAGNIDANGDLDVDGHTELDNVNIAGVCTATSFVGSGANLTSLPAANLTGTLPAISGANLTSLPAANLTGTLPAISGANLTSLPAQATIANNADNRVITGGSGVNLNGESLLTYNTSTEKLSITRSSQSNVGLYVYHSDGNEAGHFGTIGSGNEGILVLKDGGTDTVVLNGDTGGNSYINSGNLGIGTATPSGKVDISANGSTNMLMFKNNASNFARIGYNSAAGVSILDIRGEGHIRLLTGGNNEIIRFASNGGVGINTDKIRNTKNVSIAGVTRDYTNSGTDLVDAGGIILQPTISLPSTGQSYPGIFWSGNTAALGRARAGILGVAASNNDATDLVFLTKNNGGGHGLYPSDERMRLTNSGRLIIGHTSSPTSDSDKLQVISTSSGTGINIFNYSTSNYGNQIAFMKSRNNTIGSNTILQSGDRIGELNFYGNDGSGRSLGAQIQVMADGTQSNDNSPSRINLRTGTNQTMSTRLAVHPAGTVGVSKGGYANSDHSMSFTVNTGTDLTDGLMIVSNYNGGNQNSDTGKLMFCGHGQTNGVYMYKDNEVSYGKGALVFHTHSTSNSYSTQLAETARFTAYGRFGLGTGGPGQTTVDSLMHIQGNSDDGDEACQLTIEDEDTTAGSKIPSIQFKGNGVNQHRIRGTDTGGLTFASWNGSSHIQRAIIGNHAEGGAFLLNADDRGWATFRHSNNQGLRTHIRQHYAPGNAVQTRDILRIRRHNWGWGTYKITLKALYYYGSQETTYYVNGHGAGGGDNYSIVKETAHNNDWSGATVTKSSASTSSPGNSSTSFIDVRVNIPNYMYMIVYIEAYSSGYSTDPTNIDANAYCLL